MHRDDVLHGLVAELIGRAVAEAGLHACASHPCGEACGVVIAATGTFLKGGHAAELGAPHDERVLQQAALFEIAQKSGGGLVHDFAVLDVLGVQRLVAIPVAHAFATSLIGPVEELHEAHAALDEPPSEDAVARVGGLQVFHRVARLIGAIHFQNVRGLGGNVGDLGHGELHLRGEFVAGDARGQLRVAGEALEMMTVDFGNELARGRVGAGGELGGALEIAQRICGIEVGALERSRQEAGAPEVACGLRCAAWIGDRDVSGQRVVLAAERIRGPGTHAGEAIEREARGHEVLAWAMRVGLAREGVDEAHVIGQRTEMRHEIGDHLARLAAWTELPRALGQGSLCALEGDESLCAGHVLAVAFDEFGLVVKGVELAACAGAKDHQHAFRPRLVMRCAWCVGVCGINLWPDRHGHGLRLIATQQVRERDAAESGGGVSEEGAAIEEGMHGIGSFQVHRTKRNSLVLNIARANATAPCSRSIVTELLISNASGSRA